MNQTGKAKDSLAYNRSQFSNHTYEIVDGKGLEHGMKIIMLRDPTGRIYEHDRVLVPTLELETRIHSLETLGYQKYKP